MGTDDLSDSTTEDNVGSGTSSGNTRSWSTFYNLSNGITGYYSTNQADSDTTKDSGKSSDLGADDLVDGSTDDSSASESSSATDVMTDSSIVTGSEVTDSYSQHENDSYTNTSGSNSGSTGIDHEIGGSSVKNVASNINSLFASSGSVIITTGSNLSGGYTQTETDSDSSNDSDNSTNTEADDLSDGSTDDGVDTDNSTDVSSGSDSIASSGNNYSGGYTQTEWATASDAADDYNTDTPTDTLEGGTTNSGTQTDNTSENVGSTDTITSSGNNISGSYSQQDIGSESGTDGETTGDNDSWSGDSVALGTGGNAETDTTAVEMNTTDIETGNDNTEAYTLTEYGYSDPTVTDTSVEQGLAGTSTDAQTETWTTTNSGNDATGVDDSTTTDTTTDSSPVNGSDARGPYTGTSTDTDTTTTTQVGNDSTELYTTTVVSSDSSTQTISGGSGVTYSQTVFGTDNSTSTTTENDEDGSSTWTSTDAQTCTTYESGSGSGTGYSYMEIDGTTTVESGFNDSLDGDSTVTDTVTSNSNLSEAGSTSASDTYLLGKVSSDDTDSTSTGNSEDGEYTLTGSENSTSTSTETQAYGAYGATFTEILGSNDSFSELQDTESNEYSLSESGTNSDNFIEAGTDADGTFLVTEGSAGTFDDTTVGQNDTGEFDATASTGDTYSYTETVSGGASPFSETETGTESALSVQHENSELSTYTTLTSGTDLYTLAESGTLTAGTFAETVTGTDNYSTSDMGNAALQSDTSTTTGGGSWTRISSGAGATLGSGSGDNTYTLVSTGNTILGSFSESETGTDRYGLVQSFDDVANDASGNTPGNVTFHGEGLPFRDPSDGLLVPLIPSSATLPKPDFLAAPPPGGELSYSGRVAMNAMTFDKYTGYFSWHYTPQYQIFLQGCVGLNAIRLNTQNQFKLPGTRGFSDLNTALAVQKETIANTTKNKIVVLWAMQVPVPQKDLDQFLMTGSTTEYNMKTIAQARSLSASGYGQTYDFATAFQNSDLSIRFWEVMPFGESKNPDLTVVHKTNLYPTMGTVYFVVVINPHGTSPLSPAGAMTLSESLAKSADRAQAALGEQALRAMEPDIQAYQAGIGSSPGTPAQPRSPYEQLQFEYSQNLERLRYQNLITPEQYSLLSRFDYSGSDFDIFLDRFLQKLQKLP